MSGLPKKYDLDTLLNALNQEDGSTEQVDYEAYKNDVLSFLRIFDIEDGDQKVKRSTLYHLYVKWSSSPVIQQVFSREVNKYVNLELENHNYFFLNQKSIDLAVLTYSKIKEKKINKTKSKAYKTHFEQFLKDHDIKAPEKWGWVEGFYLYYLYDKWNYNKKRNNRLARDVFYQYCRLYFKSKSNYSYAYTWFKVDPKVMELISPASQKNIKDGVRNWQHGKRTKKEDKT